MNAAQLINQDSGDVEYYTPAVVIEAARRCMGGIDFDPFSSPRANEVVKAPRYCTTEGHMLYESLWPDVALLDGFAQPWAGRVWCNHPFGRDTNPRLAPKLLLEIERGEMTAFCGITFAATSEKWFRPFLRYPQCFISPRVNYRLPDGTIKVGVTKGSVVTYRGPDLDAFYREFAPLGEIKIPYKLAA